LQKARFVSDHLDAATRLTWLEEKWPAMVRAAQRTRGLSLFADEASFAQWGALRSTWARRGPQPAVPPSGQRQGYKGFGAIESCSGRLFDPGLAGRLNSASYQACVQGIMAQPTAHLFVSHAGARSHTSAATQAFLLAQSDRLTAYPLPSYAPDDHPLAYLWKKTKQRATHHKSFKDFVTFTVSVDRALAYCATHAKEVLGLFGLYCEGSGLELKQAA
jgi:hypothetical protein